jgi:PAS domain S-box-containing protein
MHRLLKRQIRKLLPEEYSNDEKLQVFLESVNNAYIGFDNDYIQLERTLELSSKESFRELSNFKEALNSSAIVTISNYQRKILFVNDHFLNTTGFSKEEVIGRDHTFVNSTSHSPEFYKKIWKKISRGKIWSGEMKNIKKDHSEYWVKVTIVPLLNKLGNPIQYLTIMNDISNQKTAEQEIMEYAKNLEKKNQELDQFAYIVSHDLKAPLRAIHNLSEWIEEDIGDNLDDETKRNLELMQGRVLRMENLINGILDYSRVGRTKVEKQYTDTKALIQELVSVFCVAGNVELLCPANMPVIFTEKILLEQIFSNLISNAIKYNDKENIKITISVKENESTYTFGLGDNGPGIEKEYQDTIFVIFQTLQSRDKIESTGVGLAIIKKIIEEKEMSIWLESKIGEGTTFYFTWPKDEKPLN